MKKLLFASSLLILIMFVVSCAPQTSLTDEELEAELAKLTPEERQQLMADLEKEEGGAMAGQAVRLSKKPYAGKISPRVLNVPKAKLVSGISKVETASAGSASSKQELKCFDDDGGDPYVAGNASKGLDVFGDKCLSGSLLSESYCVNNNLVYKQVDCKAKNKNDYCKNDRCEFSSTEDKALYDCSKLENKEKNVQYCTEAGNLIFYDRYHCTYLEGKAVPTKEIGASYNRDSLYDEVDSCAEILANPTFLSQPKDAVIGCYDSDMDSKVGDNDYLTELKSSLTSSGYIEMTTIGGGMINKVKEVDACAGFKTAPENTEDQEETSCSVGFYQKGYPPVGYTGENNECVYKKSSDISGDSEITAKGVKIFERKCPGLFESPVQTSANTVLSNCYGNFGNGFAICNAGKCEHISYMSYYKDNVEVVYVRLSQKMLE